MPTRILGALLLLGPMAAGCMMVVDEDATGDEVPLSGSPWLHTEEPPSLDGVSVVVDWQSPPPPIDLEPELSADSLWVARSPATGELWTQFDGEDGWSAAWVKGVDDPSSVRLLPVYDLPGMGGEEVILVAAGRAFLPTGDGGTFDEIGLERADADPGVTDQESLDSTLQLRFLKTCPGSYESCVVYGPDEAVAAAVDPARPPGGWSLLEALRPAGLRASDVEPLYDLADGQIRLLTSVTFDEDDDEAPAVSRTRVVFAHGGREHVAFDFELGDDWGIEEDVISGGVERLADAWMVWLWDGDRVLLGVSFHDLATGERLTEPTVVQAEPYDELDCMAGLYETHPVPVLGGERLRVAIVWASVDQAILFEPPEESGAEVSVVLPPLGEEEWVPPPYLMLGPDGVLR